MSPYLCGETALSSLFETRDRHSTRDHSLISSKDRVAWSAGVEAMGTAGRDQTSRADKAPFRTTAAHIICTAGGHIGHRDERQQSKDGTSTSMMPELLQQPV